MARRVCGSAAAALFGAAALLGGAQSRRYSPLGAEGPEAHAEPAPRESLLQASAAAAAPGKKKLAAWFASAASVAAASAGGNGPLAFVGPSAKPARQVHAADGVPPQPLTAAFAERPGPKISVEPPKPSTKSPAKAQGSKSREAKEGQQERKRTSAKARGKDRESVLKARTKERAAAASAARGKGGPVKGSRKDKAARKPGAKQARPYAKKQQQRKESSKKERFVEVMSEIASSKKVSADPRGKTTERVVKTLNNLNDKENAEFFSGLMGMLTDALESEVDEREEEDEEFYKGMMKSVREALNDEPATIQEGGLALDKVSVPLTASWAVHELYLPEEWARRLDTESLSVTDKGRQGNPFYFGRAGFKNFNLFEVAFEIGLTGQPLLERELRAMQLLSPYGSVPTLYDTVKSDLTKTTFMLVEAPLAGSLHDLLESGKKKKDGMRGLGMNMSLLILNGLVQGLQDMESVGVVQGNLDEEKILVDSFATPLTHVAPEVLLTDFRRACFVGLGHDPVIGCKGAIGTGFQGSPYRTPPEAAMNRPASLESNIWQAGLVFARMLIGGDIPTKTELIMDGLPHSDLRRLEKTREGRKEIRERIRDQFSAEALPGFEELARTDEDVAEILKGMLAKDPSERWTVAQLREAAAKAAERRHLPAARRRNPTVLSEAWNKKLW